MKVEIIIRATNKTINAMAKCMDVSIERISAYDSTVTFETDNAGSWLDPQRKVDFEEVYNKEMSIRPNPDVYFVVDKISVTN